MSTGRNISDTKSNFTPFKKKKKKKKKGDFTHFLCWNTVQPTIKAGQQELLVAPRLFFLSPHFLVHSKLFIFPLVLRVMETGRRANCRRSRWNYPRRARRRIGSRADQAVGIDSPPDETASQLNSLVFKKTKWELIPSLLAASQRPTGRGGGSFTLFTVSCFFCCCFLDFVFNERPGEIIAFLASVANKCDEEKLFPGDRNRGHIKQNV